MSLLREKSVSSTKRMKVHLTKFTSRWHWCIHAILSPYSFALSLYHLIRPIHIRYVIYGCACSPTHNPTHYEMRKREASGRVVSHNISFVPTRVSYTTNVNNMENTDDRLVCTAESCSELVSSMYKTPIYCIDTVKTSIVCVYGSYWVPST